MFKLLLLMIFSVSSLNAQVVSGHHEFVHYTEEQKREFVVKVMEFVVELDERYEKAPALEKKKYSLILEDLRKILISDAYAATTDLNAFANDLTRIFDPNIDDQKRCIYAGWASRTITTKIGGENREICQHPKFISGGANSSETRAYNKSSDCGKKTQNTISCNPAIFGFKNKQAASQFCVPAGPQFSENSSYACMQLSLGMKSEKGADPASERISYLKKQFEGNPALVNNLYGFIYKTCICDTDNLNVINKSYLSRTRPHRTCLGLINTIAETEHCVDYSGSNTTDMGLFKDLRSFTSNLVSSRTSGNRVDANYRDLLNSIPTRFSDDYAKMCGGAPFPPKDDPGGKGGGKGSDTPKECIGECDFVDGQFVNCKFSDGENSLEVTPPRPMEEQFNTELEGEQYLCRINKRGPNHKTSCTLEAGENGVTYKLSSPEGSDVKVIATKWTSGGEGLMETVPFGDHERIGLTISISSQGQDADIACGEVNNPKFNDKIPHIKIVPKKDSDNKTDFGTEVDGDDDGWTYHWTRVGGGPGPKKTDKGDDRGPKIQGESTLDSDPNRNKDNGSGSGPNGPNGGAGNEPKSPRTTADDDSRDGPITDGSGEEINHNGKEHTAPKEDDTYQVCVQLKKGDKSSNKSCADVGKKEDEKAAAAKKPATPLINNGAPRQMPQNQMRRGVDFSRGGVL